MTSPFKVGITPGRFIRSAVLRMSQAELAEELNVSQPMVSKLERLDAVPTLYRERLLAIAKKRKAVIEDAWFDRVPVTRSARAATK